VRWMNAVTLFGGCVEAVVLSVLLVLDDGFGERSTR